MAAQTSLATMEEAIGGLADRLDSQQRETHEAFGRAAEVTKKLKESINVQGGHVKDRLDRIEALLSRNYGEGSSHGEVLAAGINSTEATTTSSGVVRDLQRSRLPLGSDERRGSRPAGLPRESQRALTTGPWQVDGPDLTGKSPKLSRAVI